MTPQRGPSYFIELRRNRDGGYYLKISLDDDFGGHINTVMDWSQHDRVRVFVGECHDDGYDGDVDEEDSHCPRTYEVRRTTMFSFRLSDAVGD